MSTTKEEIRKLFLEKRKAQDPHEVIIQSRKILEHLFEAPIFYHAKHIMTYMSYPNEVQTDDLVSKAINLQKKVSVPVCIPKEITLIPSQITNLSMIEKGYFGLREPKKEMIHLVNPKEIDLVIVPGVTFDHKGNRIGHGKGYYDRFLQTINHSIPKIGLAFQWQIVREPWQISQWDIPMDGILTEEGWIYKNF
ncbi:MAG: 5-formyltetrahydrofolate cyclo-ligase [Tepidibacillus sp.]